MTHHKKNTKKDLNFKYKIQFIKYQKYKTK